MYYESGRADDPPRGARAADCRSGGPAL